MSRPTTNAQRGPRRLVRWRRALATLAIVGVIAGMTSSPDPRPTDAAFTDAEHSRATFTAATVGAPVITGTVCEKALLSILLTRFEIRWRPPAGLPTEEGTIGIQWMTDNGALTSQPSLSLGSNGEYTSTFSSGLITELLTLLLGGEGTFTGTITYTPVGASTWTSDATSTVHLTVPPLFGQPTCPFTNGS